MPGDVQRRFGKRKAGRRIPSLVFAAHLLLAVILLAGCGLSGPDPEAGTVQPIASATQTSTATFAPTPTSENTPTPAQTATTAPAEQTRTARQRAARLTSGWTVFSNPDLVTGITIHENSLWAASTGGVTAWDLETGQHTLFTPRDGLTEIEGSDIVYCPMPDPRILVAHASGMLSAYNLEQKRWSRIPITFDDGSTMLNVQSMHCDAANNRLLVGSGDGLGILDFVSNTWRKVGTAQGLKVNQISAIDVAGQAVWLAAGEDSAFLVTGNNVFPFNGASGFPSGPVHDISVSPDSTIWFAYPGSLVRYFEHRWMSYGGQARTGIPFLSMDHVEAADNRIVWISGADEGVCPFDITTLSCSTLYLAPQGMRITDLEVGANGVGYASTFGKGIMVMDGERIRWLAVESQQLVSNNLRDIAQSQDGRLWVATDQGVNVFDPAHPNDPWEWIKPERNGLVSGMVSGLHPVENGIWVFYDQKAQASFFDGTVWTQMEPGKGVHAEVLDSAVDSRGYLWFATRSGIDVWDGSVMRSYGKDTGLPGSAFNCLLPDADGMWVGSEHGLVRYARFQWTTQLPGVPVNAMIPGENGGLLLGTDHGLLRFEDGQSYLWIINLGDSVVMNPVVTSLARDKNNGLWVGTEEDGLFLFDGKSWEQFNTARGLPANTIRKVFSDQSGAVWIIVATSHSGGALVRFIP